LGQLGREFEVHAVLLGDRRSALHRTVTRRAAAVTREPLADFAALAARAASSARRSWRRTSRARAITTACTAVASWYRLDGPSTGEEIVERYCGIALDTVRYEAGDASDGRNACERSR
jgi:hypothetical protein